MPRLRHLGMLVRLLLAFALVLVPLLIFSIWSYFRSLEDRRDAALDETVQTSETAAALVHGLLRDLDSTTLAVAGGIAVLPPTITFSQETVGPYLAAVGAPYPFLRALFLLNPQGVVIASKSAEGIGLNLADRPYTAALLAGQERVLTDASPGLQSTLPTVTLARTVRTPDGALRGFLAASFYADKLEDVLPGGLPADARLSVYDRRGYLLYSNLANALTPAQREQGGLDRVQTALAGKTWRAESFTSLIDNSKRLGAIVPVPEYGWAVGVSRDIDVIDANIQHVYRWQAALLAGLVLGAAVLSLTISRALSKPLTQLAAQARAFGQGTRPLTVPRRGPPEVKALAAALAQMATEVDTRFHERDLAAAALAQSEARLQMLSSVSEALAESLDQDAIARALTSKMVPALADWCAVHLRTADGGARLFALAHREPERAERALEHLKRYQLPPDAPRGYTYVLRTGETEYHHAITDEVLAGMVSDPEHEQLLRGLGISSRICVPLVARGRIIGTLTLATAGTERMLTPDDVTLAEELGRRAATSLENAELYRNAQAALQVRDEFLSSISHDMRTPLTSITGMAQLLKRRVNRLGPDQQENLANPLTTIEHAAGRINAMVEELLDLARLEAGRPLELRREPVDLVGLARRVAEDQRRTAGGRALSVSSTEPELTGEWDAARLERVIANLLSNAIKYSPESEPVAVEISSETSGGDRRAVLAVRDRGVGIPASDLPRIFERFHRAANVRGRVSGTGIGLSGSKQIVELHGGTIHIDSRPGGGTTVAIRLPLAEPAATPA